MIDIEAMQEKIAQTSIFIKDIQNELSKVLVGQAYMVDRLLIGLLTKGHVLLEGVPGLAKTLTISSLAKVINVNFQRIQFTPDLLPADLIGTLIYNPKESEFNVKKGPIFTNIILADEINRSPAKVQSALLEAMQERQVTIGNETFKLEEPFLVLATQNPVEQEGTYPLPEAQLDRFMMKLTIGYPNEDEELEIMRRQARTSSPTPLNQVVTSVQIFESRKLIDSIYVDKKVETYIIRLIMATRYPEKYGLEDIKEFIEYGCSPRGSIALNLSSRAQAYMHKRAYVTPEDVRTIVKDTLRHRIVLSFNAEAQNISTDNIIDRCLETIQVP